ncbi:hypothetical protein GQ44DRAFT_708057 [Phaeosphaeriaceae sp. PMI808]|nr:hypothetical protein GQ44DRAFT_708057 [Phaeosphaeriaceae sp. PMI808]
MTIAGEAPITRERRAVLMRKIQDLEVAMRILRRQRQSACSVSRMHSVNLSLGACQEESPRR